MGIVHIGANIFSKIVRVPATERLFKSSSPKSILGVFANNCSSAQKYSPGSIMSYCSHLKETVIESFHLGKSAIPEVVALEQKMKSIGVKVTFADNLETAKIITSAVEKVKAAGLKIPERIILMTPKQPLLKGLTNSLVHRDIVFLNKDLSTNNIGNIPDFIASKGIKAFSANTPESVVFHEIGHFLQKEPHSVGEAWQKMAHGGFDMELAKEVSWYAVTGDKLGGGREFVAEVFAGLMSGKRYSPRVMAIYEALGGAKIPGVRPLISGSSAPAINSSGIFGSITSKFAKSPTGSSNIFSNFLDVSKKLNKVS